MKLNSPWLKHNLDGSIGVFCFISSCILFIPLNWHLTLQLLGRANQTNIMLESISVHSPFINFSNFWPRHEIKSPKNNYLFFHLYIDRLIFRFFNIECASSSITLWWRASIYMLNLTTMGPAKPLCSFFSNHFGFYLLFDVWTLRESSYVMAEAKGPNCKK